MISYREFCNQIAPLVVKLQENCRDMTEADFMEYRGQVLENIKQNSPEISAKFMSAILDMIYRNLFGKKVERSSGVA